MSRDFDIALFGASGFTGKLTAEYLAGRANGDPPRRLALAGRDPDKLAAVRAEAGLPQDTPLVRADAADPSSLAELARRSQVVLTTVGPYQLYGSPLVAACAAAGTHYVDLCGETAWMRAMIDAREAQAKASGARIVFSCGFDSIPFDFGVAYLQAEARRRFGAPCARVKGRVRKMKGTFSGGTAASFRATLAAASKDAAMRELLRDPFALTPGFAGAKQPSGAKPEYDEALGSWAAPFIMAAINTRNVHRSNYLLGHPYGADFVYDEMILTGPGERGEQAARGLAAGLNDMAGESGPKAGEGPSRAERESGFYDLLFVGAGRDGERLAASVKGDRDPGYGSTSKMIAECAIALTRTQGPGGIFTPVAAFGVGFNQTLSSRAGLSFAIEQE
ncbi:MAG: saccharopine dehydrogenase NADP-binding domain-containing protein [Pseudomonadota bacterium]|nr:saccharopine dehydrogenase NADP-binding domain-containing protein [Pseudomonadota bacterium]